MFGTYCYAVRPFLFYQMRCVNSEVWGGNLAFCVFTGRVRQLATSGGHIFCFVFLRAFSFQYDLRWPHLSLHDER